VVVKLQSEPRYAFVDVILVSAVLHIINFANCYQIGPQNARKEAKEGRERKESNHNGKEEEIVQKYESGRFGTHYGYFHCFVWEK
jgi:hypothetical protein